MQELLSKQLESFPIFLTSQDLVTLGIYPSLDAAYLVRKRGGGPDFVKMKRKILYPKGSLVEYLSKRMNRGV
jgi:hypothetical protein